MKHVILKKRVMFIVATLMVVALICGGVAVLSNNSATTPLQRTVALETSDTAKLSSLTEADLNYIFELGEKYMAENPSVTEEAADAYLRAEMLKICADKPIDQVGYYGGLTSAEFWLSVAHPIRASKAKSCADKASSKAQEFYSEGLYQGNGDAFRHGYWNALMTIKIGSEWAEKFATAHESETPEGIDKQMDLTNNSYGRIDGNTFKDLDDDALAVKIRDYVTRGLYRRIVEEKLVWTNGEGLK